MSVRKYYTIRGKTKKRSMPRDRLLTQNPPFNKIVGALFYNALVAYRRCKPRRVVYEPGRYRITPLLSNEDWQIHRWRMKNVRNARDETVETGSHVGKNTVTHHGVLLMNFSAMRATLCE